MGWLRNISRDFRHSPRISFSVSCTFFPGREPCTVQGWPSAKPTPAPELPETAVSQQSRVAPRAPGPLQPPAHPQPFSFPQPPGSLNSPPTAPTPRLPTVPRGPTAPPIPRSSPVPRSPHTAIAPHGPRFPVGPGSHPRPPAQRLEAEPSRHTPALPAPSRAQGRLEAHRSPSRRRPMMESRLSFSVSAMAAGRCFPPGPGPPRPRPRSHRERPGRAAGGEGAPCRIGGRGGASWLRAPTGRCRDGRAVPFVARRPLLPSRRGDTRGELRGDAYQRCHLRHGLHLRHLCHLCISATCAAMPLLQPPTCHASRAVPPDPGPAPVVTFQPRGVSCAAVPDRPQQLSLAPVPAACPAARVLCPQIRAASHPAVVISPCLRVPCPRIQPSPFRHSSAAMSPILKSPVSHILAFPYLHILLSTCCHIPIPLSPRILIFPNPRVPKFL